MIAHKNERLALFLISVAVFFLFVLAAWSAIKFQISFATNKQDEVYQILTAITFTIFEATMLYIAYFSYRRQNYLICSYASFLSTCLLVFSFHTVVGTYAEINTAFEENSTIAQNQSAQIAAIDEEIAGYKKAATNIELAASSYTNNQKTARLKAMQTAANYQDKLAEAVAKKNALLASQVTENDLVNSKTHSGFQNISRAFVGNISLAKEYQSYWGLFYGGLFVLLFVTIPTIVNWLKSTKPKIEEKNSSANYSHSQYSYTPPAYDNFHKPVYAENTGTDTTAKTDFKPVSVREIPVSEQVDLKPFLRRGTATGIDTGTNNDGYKGTGIGFINENTPAPVSDTARPVLNDTGINTTKSDTAKTSTAKKPVSLTKKPGTGTGTGKKESDEKDYAFLKAGIESGDYKRQQNTDTVGTNAVMRYCKIGKAKAARLVKRWESENEAN